MVVACYWVNIDDFAVLILLFATFLEWKVEEEMVMVNPSPSPSSSSTTTMSQAQTETMNCSWTRQRYLVFCSAWPLSVVIPVSCCCCCCCSVFFSPSSYPLFLPCRRLSETFVTVDANALITITLFAYFAISRGSNTIQLLTHLTTTLFNFVKRHSMSRSRLILPLTERKERRMRSSVWQYSWF